MKVNGLHITTDKLVTPVAESMMHGQTQPRAPTIARCARIHPDGHVCGRAEGHNGPHRCREWHRPHAARCGRTWRTP